MAEEEKDPNKQDLFVSRSGNKRRVSVQDRIAQRKTTGSRYLGDYKGEHPETKRYARISHSAKTNITVDAALSLGFRSRAPLQVKIINSDNLETIDLQEGVLGSGSKCSMIVRNASKITANQLYVVPHDELYDMIQFIDGEYYNKIQNVGREGIPLKDGQVDCSSMLEIRADSDRPFIDINIGDTLRIGRKIDVQIVELKVSKAVGDPEKSSYYKPRIDTNKDDDWFHWKEDLIKADKKYSEEVHHKIRFNQETTDRVYDAEPVKHELYDQWDHLQTLNIRGDGTKVNLEICYVKLRVYNSETRKEEFYESTNARTCVGSAPICDICIPDKTFKACHFGIEVRKGHPVLFDIAGVEDGVYLYLTKFVDAFPNDRLDLNGQIARVISNDKGRWKNAVLIASKRRESTRESVIPGHSNCYPKLVTSLGMQSFFNIQYLIGHNDSALLSIRDIALASSHTILSSSDESRLFVEPLQDSNSRNTRISIGDQKCSGDLINWNHHFNRGYEIKKWTKFQCGTTIFEVSQLKIEQETAVEHRKKLNAGAVEILRKIKELRFLGYTQLHQVAASMLVLNLYPGDAFHGNLDDNYYIVESGSVQLNSEKLIKEGDIIGKGPQLLSTHKYVEPVDSPLVYELGSCQEKAVVFILSAHSLLVALGPLETIKGNVKTRREEIGIVRQLEIKRIEEEERLKAEEQLLNLKKEMPHSTSEESVKDSPGPPPTMSKRKSVVERIFSGSLGTKDPVVPTPVSVPDNGSLGTHVLSVEGEVKAFKRKRSTMDQINLDRQTAKSYASDLSTVVDSEALKQEDAEIEKLLGKRKSLIFDKVVVDDALPSSTHEDKEKALGELVNSTTSKVASGRFDHFCGIEIRTLTGPCRGTTYFVQEQHISIGKVGGDATIQIPDSSLNLIHAYIVYKDGKYKLVDMSSRVGTQIILRKNDQYVLDYGETFICGETVFSILGLPSSSGESCCPVA
jgi:hypothetical protein